MGRLISWTWHKTHEPEFGAYGGGRAVFVCKRCHVDNMPGSFRWHVRCRPTQETDPSDERKIQHFHDGRPCYVTTHTRPTRETDPE